MGAGDADVLGRLGSAFTDQISPFSFVDAGYDKSA
jgi:hypothetical protein